MNSETESKNYLNEKWQRINKPSKEDYVEKIAGELKEIHSLIEQLDLTSDIPKLPKMLMYGMEENISKVKTTLSSLVELAKRNELSGNDISELLQ
jgi:wyosine [tRNA(Phe)-imidazoG37] synthetase (radical SAM superfamily)